MFAVLLASYAMNAMDRQVFPLILPEVRREFGFNLPEAGLKADSRYQATFPPSELATVSINLFAAPMSPDS